MALPISIRALAGLAAGCAGACAVAATTVPSIEITGVNSSSCTPAGASLTVLNNLPTGNVHSDNFQMYSGSTLIYTWTGESYDSVSSGSYGTHSGTTVAANTQISSVIYTFPSASSPPAPFTQGTWSYRSQIDYDCTTGQVFRITNTIGGPAVAIAPVPTLGDGVLAALACLLAASGAWLARRNAWTQR